ncbi:unnamed protein product [Mycena citricolor]|nr:unnamed protein product [Mycena citricolor]
MALSLHIAAQMINMSARNEQNMKSVERLIVYAELPAEGASTTPNDPPASWPDHGPITFKDIQMPYREGLPPVLKGVRLDVKAGENIGIVGRTGTGKSSLQQCLFRIVELQLGQVDIDGANIAGLGLDVLRDWLTLVPQDGVLFLGALRENLNPPNSRTDTELLFVLRREWSLPRPKEPTDPIAKAKLSLNSTIDDEGSNYSARKKQLLTLCRALMKSSPIRVLDEAASSVGVEMDGKLQRTIRTEFANSVLLRIAHRLNTLRVFTAPYDRILGMDQVQVVE